MLKKFGVNSTRAEKSGPTVKRGISGPTKKTITCSCGRRFEKTCPNDLTCEISSFVCPHCGNTIK